jgi:ankyrin repeat protein
LIINVEAKANDKAKAKGKLTGLERLTQMNIDCTEDNFCHFVKKDRVDIVSDFLESGFDPNKQNAAGQTPLFVAAMNNSLKVAKLLLSKGVEVDARDIDGSTPLMYAAFNHKHKMVELLIKHKADVNAQNNKGWTALMYAVESGNKKTIDALLTKDTNYLLRNKEKVSARDIALRKGYDKLPQYMEDKILYLQDTEKPAKNKKK